jgi:hypothetical protein
MNTLRAWHGDPAIQQKYVTRFAAHRAADEVIQGTGFDNGRGCFVGCTLDEYAHERFPIELGWPEWLAHLADAIFEGLPKADAPQFGTDMLAAPRPGADLEPVRWKLSIARHRIALKRLEGNAEPYAVQVTAALNSVIELCEAKLAGSADDEAESAAWAAAAAARATAQSAAQSVAASAWSSTWSERATAWAAAAPARAAAREAVAAAWSAAWSAESAARSSRLRAAARATAQSAAWAAAGSAEASSAESAAWRQEADTLLQLLREA